MESHRKLEYAIRAYEKCSRRGYERCHSMCGDGEVGQTGYSPLMCLFVSGNRKWAQRIFYDAASVHHCVSVAVTTSRYALKRYAKRTTIGLLLDDDPLYVLLRELAFGPRGF